MYESLILKLEQLPLGKHENSPKSAGNVGNS